MNRIEKYTQWMKRNPFLLPLLIILCVIPLVVRIYIFDTGLIDYPWYAGNGISLDFFLYYKGILLVITAIVMFCIWFNDIYRNYKKKKAIFRIREEKWCIPLLIFMGFALLSTLFSKYPYFGFHGIIEQHESIWVILSYGIILMYTCYFVRTREDINVIKNGIAVLLIIMGILGLGQLVGYDFFETDVAKRLYLASYYEDYKDAISFVFSQSGNHQVYLTLYNPNYVGVFVALVFPITVMLCIGYKDFKQKALWGILSVVVFLLGLGCGSKAFLISIVITLVLGSILYAKKHWKRLIPVGLGCVLLLAVLIGYMNYIQTDIFQYVKNAMTPQENDYSIEDFIIHEDYVELIYEGTSLYIQMLTQNGQIFFYVTDANGTIIQTYMDENLKTKLNDKRFEDISIALYSGYDEYAFVGEIQIGTDKYAFAKGLEGYTYMNYIYKPDTIVTAEAGVFQNYDSLYSGRGYIWSRTIPLLKYHLLLGSGADTFTLEFPQNDYVGKNNAGYDNLVITKPHNIYLQIGVQYGMIALIAFCTMAGIYVLQSLKLCMRSNFDDLYSCLALGNFLGITGYGIMGISNDSCVALAPIAWLLLGLGFAVNKILIKETSANNVTH